MNREEIIKLAREAGIPVGITGGNPSVVQIERFAAIVAAAEREACAQSLDKQADLACDAFDRKWAQEMAAAIRARGNT